MPLSSHSSIAPGFSVIVNCRNSERFLIQCLESIRRQTYPDFEVIIWDNKSEDRTFEIASDFCNLDNRFFIYRGAISLKLGAARNSAIQKARGKFIAFLDSDDLWDPNFLNDHIKVLQNSNQKTFGIGNVIEIDSGFNLSRDSAIDKLTNESTAPDTVFRKLLKGNFIYFSSLILPRSFFEKQKGFKPEYVQAEDYELLLRASQELECYKTGLAYYRIHEGNATGAQQEELFAEALQILKPYSRYFWGWISYKLTAVRYFLYLDQPSFGQRLEKLKELHVSKFDLFIGGIILGIVTIKSEFLRKKKS
jgi:glycosyltransferase involved in cell wall biosynthesis